MDPKRNSPEHLCVLVHGLWGNPNHLNYLRDTLQAQHSDERLYILQVKSNADSFTYDGVEVGGERITNEIEQKIKELETEGAKIKKISMIGYSLGGLVSRYAIGLLYKNGLFDDIEPVNFTTFATPHLGIKTPKKGYRSTLWNFMGSRTLSVSGQQMFLIDKFRDSGRPLLSLMADDSSIFMKGLSLFKNKTVYANTQNDRSVPWFTSGIDCTDPYVDLDKVDVHYLPGQEDPVILDPDHPVSLRKSPKYDSLSRSERLSLFGQQTRTAIPFYAFFFSLFPIMLPAFLVNSMIQTYKSSQRVQLHETGQAGINLGRYRIPLLEEAQAFQDRTLERMASQTEQEFLPTPPPEPVSNTPSTSSLGSHQPKKMSRRRSRKDDSPFPVLALSDEQFEMMDSLDGVGFTKFPVHIQRHRHTHAAIVVRIQKESFAEGKVVVNHWAARLEV